MATTLRDTAAVRSLGGGRLVGQHEYQRIAGSVGLSRLLVEDVLVEHGVEERRVLDAAVLLTSELTTDAVRHGRGDTFLVAITVGARQVQVNVTSAVSAPDAAADAAPDAAPGAAGDDAPAGGGATDGHAPDAAAAPPTELHAPRHRGPELAAAGPVPVAQPCVVVPFRGEGRLVALPAPAPEHPDPDIAEHSRTIVDILASSWDVRQSATERTAWFSLDR